MNLKACVLCIKENGFSMLYLRIQMATYLLKYSFIKETEAHFQVTLIFLRQIY